MYVPVCVIFIGREWIFISPERMCLYLKNHKLIDRRLKKTKADTLSVSLAFVFDINYKKTFEILRDRSYLDKEIDIYINKTTNQKLKEQLKESRSIINNYIDRRCL